MDGVFVSILRGQPATFISFLFGLLIALSLPLLAIIGFLLYGLFSMRYLVGRDSLTISWARRQEVIPLAAIESIAPLGITGERIRTRGVRWPGYRIARGHGDEVGEVLFYSTDRPAEQLLITTPARSFVISPSNPTGFLSALQARQSLGPARDLHQRREEQGLIALPFWHDWKALALAASGALANVGLFAYVTARYPYLPELIPLLSEAGQVKLIGTKEELFEMPIIGLAVYLVNTILGFALHRSERPLTYSLIAIGLLVQIVFWSAAIAIIG